MQETMKKEPFSATSTPRKKPFSVKGEELYSTISPCLQSRSTAKLTNMLAEDLPHSDQKPYTKSLKHSPQVNTFGLQFTVADAATDNDLYAGNRRQPNNNNANRGRPSRGTAPNRGAPGRGGPGRGAVPNRGAPGRGAPGRGVPPRGGVPRGVPGQGQGPHPVPIRNLRGQLPNPNPNLPNPNPNPPSPNPNPPPNPVGPRYPGAPGGPGGPGGLDGPGGPGPPGPNGPPPSPAAGRGANPVVLAILDRLVTAQEKQVTDKKDTKRFTQFPSDKFDGTELGKLLDH